MLDLLQDIQNETGIAYLFISHDMAVVEQISHRVAVMYGGQFVEVGTRRQVFENPQHDYTKQLLSAVPVPDPRRERRLYIENAREIRSPIRPLDYVPVYNKLVSVGEHHLVATSA